MKRLQLAVLAISLTGILAAGNVLAADTTTLDVTATVLESCRFDSAGGTLDFGDLDALNPADQVDVPPTLNPFFTCSAGTAYTISDDSATNPLNNGTDTIDYSLSYATSGTADGLSTELSVTGTILAAAYAGVSAGVYDATVTFSINP